MNKRGFIFRIIIGFLLLIIVATIGAAVYFYYFHTFKTIRVCLPEEGRDTNVTCETKNDCLKTARAFAQTSEVKDIPGIINRNSEMVENASMYCNSTCYIRDSRGFNPSAQDIRFLESCNDTEIEVTSDIKGKDAIQIFNWLKN